MTSCTRAMRESLFIWRKMKGSGGRFQYTRARQGTFSFERCPHLRLRWHIARGSCWSEKLTEGLCLPQSALYIPTVLSIGVETTLKPSALDPSTFCILPDVVSRSAPYML